MKHIIVEANLRHGVVATLEIALIVIVAFACGLIASIFATLYRLIETIYTNGSCTAITLCTSIFFVTCPSYAPAVFATISATFILGPDVSGRIIVST